MAEYFELSRGTSINSCANIDTKPSMFDAIEELVQSDESGESWTPGIIPEGKQLPRVRVVKMEKPRLVLDWLPFGVIVSQSVAECFKSVCDDQVQFLKLSIEWPKSIKVKEDYFWMNVTSVVDCIHTSEVGMYYRKGDSPERLSIRDPDATLTLDVSRIPKGSRIFYTKYYRCVPIISKRVYSLINAEFPKLFDLRPVDSKRQPDQERSHHIANIVSGASKTETSQIKQNTNDQQHRIEKSLSIALPKKVATYFNGSAELDGMDIELLDGVSAIEETQRLRDWNELAWPKHLVCISEDGRGGYFALDLSKAKDGDCPVVYFDHELVKIDKKTGRITPHFELAAKTFDAWIKRLKRGGSAMPKR